MESNKCGSSNQFMDIRYYVDINRWQNGSQTHRKYHGNKATEKVSTKGITSRSENKSRKTAEEIESLLLSDNTCAAYAIIQKWNPKMKFQVGIGGTQW